MYPTVFQNEAKALPVYEEGEVYAVLADMPYHHSSRTERSSLDNRGVARYGQTALDRSLVQVLGPPALNSLTGHF